MCNVFFQIFVCPFVLFLLTIVLSELLRFMDSDYGTIWYLQTLLKTPCRKQLISEYMSLSLFAHSNGIFVFEEWSGNELMSPFKSLSALVLCVMFFFRYLFVLLSSFF
jgi:CDP-glycerol glycerophosphotransferase (TagB/SpsB family)